MVDRVTIAIMKLFNGGDRIMKVGKYNVDFAGVKYDGTIPYSKVVIE